MIEKIVRDVNEEVVEGLIEMITEEIYCSEMRQFYDSRNRKFSKIMNSILKKNTKEKTNKKNKKIKKGEKNN